MKNFITAALFSFSVFSTAHAEGISKEKYRELMFDNRTNYELVEAGMNSVGVGVNSVITDQEGNEFKCRQAVESTVIQVYGSQYLTHEKVKSLDDCGGTKVEGQVEEYLQWNKLYTVEEHLELLESRFDASSFFVKDGYVEFKAKTKKSELSEPRDYKRLTNIQESQFCNIKAYSDGLFSWTQFYTRKIDPSSIAISDLEVREIFN